MAIGYSPLYLEENGDAIRHDWPRVPLPSTSAQLMSSARLGQRVADLLGTDKAVPSTTMPPTSRRIISQAARTDGKPLAPQTGDLAVTAGWASEQTRTQKSGAMSRIVMPGRGRVEVSERTDIEHDVFIDR